MKGRMLMGIGGMMAGLAMASRGIQVRQQQHHRPQQHHRHQGGGDAYRSQGGVMRSGFDKTFAFVAKRKEIRICSKHGMTLNCNQMGRVSGNGGSGPFTKFIAVECGRWNGGPVYRLQSAVSGKYLRILGNKQVNCSGGLGRFTRFRVHLSRNRSEMRLESECFTGHFINCNRNGVIGVGQGGDLCWFKALRRD